MDDVLAVKGFVAFRKQVLILKNKYVSEGFILPGGRLKREETVNQGLMRQVKKETGLDIIVGNEVAEAKWYARIDGKTQRVCGRFFACTTNQPLVTLDQEHTMSAWIFPHTYQEAHVIENNWIPFAIYAKKYG